LKELAAQAAVVTVEHGLQVLPVQFKAAVLVLLIQEAVAVAGMQAALASLSSSIARPLAEYCPSKAPVSGLALQV
jgi:hypothetical protein